MRNGEKTMKHKDDGEWIGGNGEELFPVMRVSKKGWTLPLDGMPLDQVLSMEVCRGLVEFTEPELYAVCDDLERHFGSTENAITAIRNGEVEFLSVEERHGPER